MTTTPPGPRLYAPARIIPNAARPSVVYGWSRDDIDAETVEKVGHFLAHGDTSVLRGTPYEVTD